MRVSRAVLAVGAPLAMATSVVACQTPSSVTVAVSTDVVCEDLAVKSDAHVVVARPDEIVGALDASSSKRCERRGAIGDVVLLPAGDDVNEVAFRVVLGVGRPTQECGVVDTGLPEGVWAGCIVSRRRLAFLDGEALTVDVPLYERCIGVPCEEGVGDNPFTTCNAKGECVPADLDAEDCIGGCDVDDLPGTVTSAAASTGAGEGGAGAGGEGGAASGGGAGGGEPTCAAGEICVLPDGGEGHCAGDGICVACSVAADCAAGEVCIGGECLAGGCGDDALGEGETDVDCGGSLCPPCAEGQACAVAAPGGGGDMPDDASCQSYVCILADGYVCAPCTTDDECVEHGRYCDTETWECELPRQLGADCERDAWCASGSCAVGADGSGVCCDEPCAGACEACGADGTCVPRPADTPCGEASCVGAEVLSEPRCDGDGLCLDRATACEDGSTCIEGACVLEGGTSGVGGSGGGGDDAATSSATSGIGGSGAGGDGGADGATSSTGGGSGGTGGDGGSSSVSSSTSGGDGGAGLGGGRGI